MKKCIKCAKVKEETDFLIEKRSGRTINTCTPCMREHQRLYRLATKDKMKEYKREYQIANKERLNQISSSYRENNLDKRRAYLKSYNARRRLLTKQRRESDPLYRATECLRNGVTRAFAMKGWGKGGQSKELLGADYQTIKIHIERQFKKGMSWDRRGEIHIDHIIPLSSAKTIEELKTLCHYTNLQPLWKLDNLKKNSRVPQVQMTIPI